MNDTLGGKVPDTWDLFGVDVEYVLDRVLEALRSPEVQQQIVLEIDPLENKMTVQMVDTATRAICAVLGKQGE